MGKANIESHTGAGLYQVTIEYGVENKRQALRTLGYQISNLETRLAATEDETAEHYVIKLQIAALKKEQDNWASVEETMGPIAVWCADLTEDLTGSVGTIEVPGESVSFNIQPGHEGNAEYKSSRDGQLVPTLAQDYAGAFFNLAALPGWQKWKPTFRYGTISEINGDLCEVELESTQSSQQAIDINQQMVLSDVPIEYLNCNGAAFTDGDSVLVMFEGQNIEAPKVIGFKEEPKPCGAYLYVEIDAYCFVYLLKEKEYKEDIPLDDESGNAVFPCTKSSISKWLNDRTVVSAKSPVTVKGKSRLYNYAIPYTTNITEDIKEGPSSGKNIKHIRKYAYTVSFEVANRADSTKTDTYSIDKSSDLLIDNTIGQPRTGHQRSSSELRFHSSAFCHCYFYGRDLLSDDYPLAGTRASLRNISTIDFIGGNPDQYKYFTFNTALMAYYSRYPMNNWAYSYREEANREERSIEYGLDYCHTDYHDWTYHYEGIKYVEDNFEAWGSITQEVVRDNIIFDNEPAPSLEISRENRFDGYTSNMRPIISATGYDMVFTKPVVGGFYASEANEYSVVLRQEFVWARDINTLEWVEKKNIAEAYVYEISEGEDPESENPFSYPFSDTLTSKLAQLKSAANIEDKYNDFYAFTVKQLQ